MPHLLMLAPAPVIRLPDGRLRLDVKYVEGMRAHQALWDGTLSAVVWEGASSVPFGAEYAPWDLGFDLIVLPAGATLPATQADLIAAPADMAEALALVRGPVPVVFVVEYTIGTRLRIVALDRDRGVARKSWSALWNLWMEARRRMAFRRAAGVQCNGYPAFDAYAGLNTRTMLYLDGRMRAGMMATPEDMAAKAAHQGPLRLVHSGRLEPMKGAQDLIPIAQALVAAGVDFTLDVFGTGALEAELQADAKGLQGRLRLHDPVDFETVLVPWMRANADLFLSCHRQADPSCTYLESLGCGVPVVGYANEMWGRMVDASGAGWAVPLGDRQALTRQIALAAQDRGALTAAANAGLSFAQAHGFDDEFSKRMAHFAACLAPQRTVV
ncbi:MAG: glycosyltransferase [Pseudotabrizicola sp.]|uniref:glycosyltransferase n=1 Tax=Pseudotabrizicola sp. TaxID=2939647 RepID=UPI0027257034|nr:glycosyltransferase [Pseudotabrizicola sp.]MDO8882488.1 glycosyltransferase [Pseudotabrizicola sp.]MDP2080093.1 glycosyltransferase [Pseudotabrizicola sp.]MDZ7575539.1 glycosyltransferase [Pseudotabrizicola sp.]